MALNQEFESKHHRGPHGRWIKGAAKLLKRDAAAVGRIEGSFKAHDLPTPAHAAAFSGGHRRRLSPEALGNFHHLATALRTGDATDPQIARIDAGMDGLTHDLVLTRHVDPAAFGLKDATLAAGLQKLAGKKIADKAYFPTALHQAEGAAGVTMHISAPKGTRALVAGDNEVWLGRDTELAITGVEPNGRGGYNMHLVVLPPKPVRKTAAAAPPAVPAEPQPHTHESIVAHASTMSDADLAQLHDAIGAVRQQRKATKATKAATPAKANAPVGHHVEQLNQFRAQLAPGNVNQPVEDAQKYVAGVKSAQLTALAKEVGAYGRTAGDKRKAIVQVTVGREADAVAIMHGGRAEKPPKTVKAVVSAPSDKVVSGNDISEDREVLRTALANAEQHPNEIGRHQQHADPLMGGLAKESGFDGPAEQADAARIQEEIDRGGLDTWRGVEPIVRYGEVMVSAEDMAKDYRTGTAWYGTGGGANGIYTTTSHDAATRYAGGRQGTAWRIVLRHDAKTIGHIDLATQHAEWMSSARRREGRREDMILDDPGRFAMARGYDAIVAPLTDPATGEPSGETYVVILNRTATLVETR